MAAGEVPWGISGTKSMALPEECTRCFGRVSLRRWGLAGRQFAVIRMGRFQRNQHVQAQRPEHVMLRASAAPSVLQGCGGRAAQGSLE